MENDSYDGRDTERNDGDMTFGDALERLKAGYKVIRWDWDYNCEFVVYQKLPSTDDILVDDWRLL